MTIKEAIRMDDMIDVAPVSSKSLRAGTVLSGHCPKCKGSRLERCEIPITNEVWFRCRDCGHVEKHGVLDIMDATGGFK